MIELQEPIYEKQKGERSKAFYLFTLYRDMGPLRSISRLQNTYTKVTKKSMGLDSLYKYSSNNSWDERVDAFDKHQDKILQFENDNALKEMARRHAKNSRVLQDEVLKVKDDIKFESLEPGTKAWLLNTTVHSYHKIALLERLSLGETTDNINIQNEESINVVKEVKDLFKFAKEEDMNRIAEL
jgi:hypothetical protein